MLQVIIHLTSDRMDHFRHLYIDVRPLPKFHQTGVKRGVGFYVWRRLKLRQVIDYHAKIFNPIREAHDRS